MTLAVRDLRFHYPGTSHLLDGIILTVPPGSSHFLLGPSGSGKTTLLRCIAGLQAGYQGSVRWNEETLDALPPHRRGVGLLFQEPALFPHLRAWQNVAFGLRYRGVARREQKLEARRWMALAGLEEKLHARVDELSGGERQRVALVRTLAARPRAVLLDEPLSALDRDLRHELGSRIKQILADEGVAALWVTHDRDEAFRWGDAVWQLEAGRCVRADSP